jgi:hypothetical protein
MKIASQSSKLLRDQEKLAIALRDAATKAVGEYRRRIERDHGLPIVMESLETETGAGGTVRPLWDQRTRVRCHSIDLAPCEPWARPHKLAHELIHIQLECAAFAAGVRRSHVMLTPTYQHFMAMCDPRRKDDPTLLRKIFNFSLNVPVDMIVELRLQREFPVLKPAQFVNLHRLVANSLDGHRLTRPWDVSPQFRQAFDSLVALRSRFVNQVAPAPGKQVDPFDGTSAGRLAWELYDEFKTVADQWSAPGGHYAMVDRFAEIIGLPGLHDWVPEPIFELAERAAARGLAPAGPD